MKTNEELHTVLDYIKISHNKEIREYYNKITINSLEIELFEELLDLFGQNYDFIGKEIVLKYVLTISNDPTIYSLLGNTLKKLNKDEEALESFNIAIHKDPNNFTYHYNKGVFYYERKKYLEAAKSFEYSANCNRNYDLIFYNWGNTLTKLEQYNSAVEKYKRAIELNNKFGAAYFNLGVVYENIGLIKEAIVCYDRAVHLEPENPSFHWNRSLLLFYLKRYDEGFKEYEWRLKKTNYKYKFPGSMWKGESLIGKRIMVYTEQGFGDVFLFLRFVKYLKLQTAYIIFNTKKTLLTLLEANKFADEYLDIDDKNLHANYDFYISLLSLPAIVSKAFIDELMTFPYIKHHNSGESYLDKYNFKNKIKIGIVWKGNPEPAINKVRHTELKCFNSIACLENVKLFSLQLGNCVEELTEFGDRIINLAFDITDFLDTAAIIMELDLIVTIDTALIHLAGAMNKPAFLLLSDTLDWRWIEENGKSVLYPSVTIIKQKTRGNWEDVFVQLKEKLLKYFDFPKRTPKLNLDEPNLFDHYEKMGIEYYANDNFVEAINCFEKCIEIDSANFRLINNLGLAYQKNHQFNKAIENYNKSIDLKYDYVSPYLNLANIYLAENNYSSAEKLLKTAKSIFTTNNEIVFLLGLLNQKLERFDIAEKYYLKLRNSNYNNLDLMLNLGLLYSSTGHLVKASNLFMEAVQKYPNNPEVFFNLGNINIAFENYDRAFDLFSKAIQLDENYLDAYLNIGTIYFNTNRFGDSFKLYEFLINKNLYDFRVLYSLGVLYYEMADYNSAKACFENSLVMEPNNTETHVGYSEVLLVTGELIKGWQEYEWRIKKDKLYFQILDKIPTDFANLKGKNVLIIGEQGVGDNIMFSRYLLMLLKINPSIYLFIRKDLRKLFNFAFMDVKIVEKVNIEDYDYIIPLLSLPRLFNTDLVNIPVFDSYLKCDMPNIEKFYDYFSIKNKKIGICWKGKKNPPFNRKRHTTLIKFIEMISTINSNLKFKFFNLQYEINEEEIILLKENDITNLMHGIKDLSQTAAIISSMDLIITVDTSIAHIASAMGKETWILLPFSADWRWLEKRTDSPWYPSCTLFRQNEPNIWNDVFEEIGKKLNVFLMKN
ncbi:MAG: tetratricopeptide repeat protein [bacterium]